MRLSTPEKAQALLRAIGHGTEHDRSMPHHKAAASFVSCFLRGQPREAWSLAQLLSTAASDHAEACHAAAELVERARFPIDALAWAWADQGTDPGQLDLRLSRRTTVESDASAHGDTAIGAIARTFANGLPQGIHVISGPTGTGKTVANVFAAVRHGGHFLRAASLGEMSLGDADGLKDLARKPILVIDELGRESDIRPTPARVTELLGIRHDQRLTTLITTQLIPRHRDDPFLSFEGRYGGHILDRIEKGGRWTSLRQASRRTKTPPELSKIRKSCWINESLLRVEMGRFELEDHKAEAQLNELQRLLEISHEEIERASSEQKAWMASLKEEVASLDGFVGDTLRAMLGTGLGR